MEFFGFVGKGKGAQSAPLLVGFVVLFVRFTLVLWFFLFEVFVFLVVHVFELKRHHLGLLRCESERLSASQLMRRNPTEAIVDKDNHLRDCLKYVVLSRPAPAEVPRSITRERIIQEAFQDGTYGTLGVRMAQLDEQERRESEPVSYVSRLPRLSD